MILESKVGDKLVLIDCEASAGISKGDVGGEFEPDKVLASAVDLMNVIAATLSPVAVSKGVGDVQVEFGIKCLNSGLVFVATTPNHGQFQIKMRLKAKSGP